MPLYAGSFPLCATPDEQGHVIARPAAKLCPNFEALLHGYGSCGALRQSQDPLRANRHDAHQERTLLRHQGALQQTKDIETSKEIGTHN